MYRLPVLIVDSGSPALSSTNTLSVRVCDCDSDGVALSCGAVAYTATGLSTGALLAILGCIITLLGKPSMTLVSQMQVQLTAACVDMCGCVCVFVCFFFFFFGGSWDWLDSPEWTVFIAGVKDAVLLQPGLFFLFVLDCFLFFGGFGGHAILDILKTFYTNLTVKSPNCTTISLFVLKFRLKSFDVLTLTECK